MTTVIQFTVPGEPASKARARFTGRGYPNRVYTPERTREAEGRVAAEYLRSTRRSNKADFKTAFAVTVEFHLARHQRRDVDNMLKLILDGLNKIAWADDNQVTQITGIKLFDAAEGRTVVTIEPVGEMPRSEATCEHCGKTYPRPPSHAAKKYCNAECRRAGIAAKRTKTCKQCGEKFVKHNNVSEQDYCSIPCFAASRHVDSICVNCGTGFKRARHLMRSGNAYCSPECKAGYWRDQRKGAAKGTCQDCGGPTSKKSYKRCLDCSFAAGGAWTNKKRGAA